MGFNTGTILVIDDDAFNRILLQTNLEEEGYTVEVAEHGKQGMEVLRTQAFDLVLTDLMMPEMNGFEVLQWMKHEPDFQHIPIIVVSGEDDMDSVIRCIETGAIDYLQKPFDPVLLRTRVKNALQATRPLRIQGQEQAGKLLVVDDDLLNRTLLATNLQEQEYTVETAENGRQALDMLHKKSFDVVLLDLLMPDMDGFDVLKVMKADTRLQHIPVTMITSENDLADIVRCIELGAEGFLFKPFEPTLLKARVNSCLEKKWLWDQQVRQQHQLNQLNTSLEVRNRFIRQTFGRYLSDEIVDTILKSPEGLALGGEKRHVTIMMTDLRGFTATSERLPAESVVGMLNLYFDVMAEIIFTYQGTIDEFQGDAILAIFGAPITRADDAQRAVACALEMQLAMEQVNQRNQELGYPTLAMGIGVNTGDVVVGNIGSTKRTKYGIVGQHVNLTSRIESYTVGGQILISESTLNACGDVLRIDDQMEVMPKGVKAPITIYEIGGIGGNCNIFLPAKPKIELVELPQPIIIRFTIIEGKHAGKQVYPAKIVKLKEHLAEIAADRSCRELTNLKISVYDTQEREISADLYAKVTESLSETPPTFRAHFTAIPPEAEDFLQQSAALRETNEALR